MRAMIGEISIIPRRGVILLAKLRTGSVTSWIKPEKALCTPELNHDRTTRTMMAKLKRSKRILMKRTMYGIKLANQKTAGFYQGSRKKSIGAIIS